MKGLNGFFGGGGVVVVVVIRGCAGAGSSTSSISSSSNSPDLTMRIQSGCRYHHGIVPGRIDQNFF